MALFWSMRNPMAYISATNPPVHKIGNSLKSILEFHVTRKLVDVNERLDRILEIGSQLGDHRACKEEKKSDKSKTEAGARSRRWSHCG